MPPSKNQNKTVPTSVDVVDFLNAVEHDTRREDAFVLLDLLKELTGEEPVMWGPSIVGYGTYHYKYPTGREGDMPLAGFSPRKAAITVYIMAGFSRYEELMAKLGKYKTGKSCLYIKKLADVDIEVLKELIVESVEWMKNKTWD